MFVLSRPCAWFNPNDRASAFQPSSLAAHLPLRAIFSLPCCPSLSHKPSTSKQTSQFFSFEPFLTTKLKSESAFISHHKQWITKLLLLLPVAVAATTAVITPTALPSALLRVPRLATTAARRATLAASAPLPRPRRPATVAVAPATSAVSAHRLVVPPAVAPVARSATSAASRATSPATAPRAVAPTVAATAAAVVASAARAPKAVRADTGVLARPPATPAAVSVT
ncbi:uncharacterized protein M421DRAFT_305826 [Didymella exigua CBS 183.55]|uniref:Uncharacterized protein n=1 Tax=Didymella exigua CBS 183.55 TaxID=1150837 RepID=A0A6A5R9C0_9PLEO|nr:uncharacterized protein M421DRAFT_305826 [Didymella exigua CBS 183.55]KAF1923788.1 hypothetical protein M421DRAFT_305826 [Didymella exigua CBS 183.55]